MNEYLFDGWCETISEPLRQDILPWLTERLDQLDGHDFDALAAEFYIGVDSQA